MNTNESYLSNLRTEVDSGKYEAITTLEGPLLIIAGPGSGKTKTLVERTINLILNGVSPNNIFLTTFTEKAAKELITRISNKLIDLNISVNIHELYIGTFHSIFLRILKENREFTRIKRNFRILDDFDQKYFIFNKFYEFIKVNNHELIIRNNKQNRWEKSKILLKYLNKISEECLNIDLLLKSEDPSIVVLGEFYNIYQKLLYEENALDFSNIQSEILYLLENNPEILTKLQSSIKYIMIDEYQDTNTIQEKIIFLLSSSNKNICVVGDDDQSLYRFRGASVRNILEFPSHFSKDECKIVNLSTNYRSHPDIIDFYSEWMNGISWTKNGVNFRYHKDLKPREDEFVNNPSVIKLSTKNSWDEYYEEVYNFIDSLRKNNKLSNLNQIAFLFKSVKNENVIELANYLENRGINVFSPRSALFFERKEIKLLIGALIFIFPNLFDDLKWNDAAQLEIWKTYENWKRDFAFELRQDPAKHKDLLEWCRLRSKQHLNLSTKTDYAFSALLYQLLEYPMFADFIKIELTDNKVSLRTAYNIALLSKLFYKFEYIYNISVLTSANIIKTLQYLFNVFFRFLIDGGMEEFEDFDEYAPSGCVSFMTIHQSKGLEFPIVIVGSLNLVPRKDYDEIDVILQDKYFSKPPFEPIEEIKNYDFRRLFYTAYSRAQNLLILSTRENNGKGLSKSPSKEFLPVYSKLVNWTHSDFESNKLILDTIKPINIKHEYSFTSHILLYDNCPLQYKFYKELEFVEVRAGGVLGGSLLHQTIEDIHKTVLRNEEHLLTNENITQWFNDNYFLLSKQTRSYLHQAQINSLLKQVLRYRDVNTQNWSRIKEAEVDVSLVKENYILKGTIDLIKGENDTVELIDFKSGDKPDVNSNEPIIARLLIQYRRQLEVYAHLIEERSEYKVSRLHLYYPKEENGSPYITFESNRDNIEITINSFENVVKKIETKNYDMSKIIKSEKQCGNCDMRYHCNPKHFNKYYE